MIADEDLKLYPGAKPAEDEKKAAEGAAKAAEEPKNKARKSVKNKTKVEE